MSLFTNSSPLSSNSFNNASTAHKIFSFLCSEIPPPPFALVLDYFGPSYGVVDTGASFFLGAEVGLCPEGYSFCPLLDYTLEMFPFPFPFPEP